MNKTPELVDLELPSGNLWMTKNLGAESEADPGNYYQLGSLVGYQGEEALKHSTWETCPFNNGKNKIDEEYFKANRYKLVYKNGNLRPEFDAVTQTFGPDFKLPEPKDFQELIDNTTSEYIKNYKKVGILFTSKINGKTLFIPFSGYVCYGRFCGVDSYCSLWSGGLDFSYPYYACYLYCNFAHAVLYNEERLSGLTLRGIKEKK